MNTLELVFCLFAFLIFYTYLGYGLLLYFLVKIKELFIKKDDILLPLELSEVTLLIAAYNEEDVVKEKMINCRSLDYPKDKLKIVWVTDGSNDRTNFLLKEYDDVKVLYDSKRGGKAAAFNRAMPFIKSPLTIYTDANTMLCKEAIMEIVKEFTRRDVACVAGEKRVSISDKQDATAGEGVYWKYESKLKELDYRLYSAVGAAGELFAIRTEFFEYLPVDTLLDDFVLSMRIAQKGYKIAYCKNAYAVESGSANIFEESKRKVRIAAGGLQSVWRLRSLLNPFKYGVLSFQYISHKVLRWTVTPIALVVLFPLNIFLIGISRSYLILFILQILFYMTGFLGYILMKRKIKNKLLFIPYYFLFMNLNVLRAFTYLIKNKGKGAWEKSKRSV